MFRGTRYQYSKYFNPTLLKTKIQETINEHRTLPKYLLSLLSNKPQSLKKRVAIVNADTKSSLTFSDIEKMIIFIGETHRITINNLFNPSSSSSDFESDDSHPNKLCAVFLPNHESYFPLCLGLMHAGIKVVLLDIFESIHTSLSFYFFRFLTKKKLTNQKTVFAKQLRLQKFQ